MRAEPGSAGGVPGHADPPPGELDREIAVVAQRLDVIVEQYDAAREDLVATRARVRWLTARMRPLAAQLGTARRRVDGIAARAYRTGQLGGFQALLAAGSPGAFVDRLTTLDGIARSQQRDLSELTDVATRLERQKRTMAALQGRQAEQERVLGDVRSHVQQHIARLDALRARLRKAGGAGGGRPPGEPSLSVNTTDPGLKAVSFAYAQLGKPYRFGAAGPDEYDCSGLTMAAWRTAGVQLPHHSGRQYAAIPHVRRADLRAGDLVFYYHDRHRVAIYVGDGKVIDAPQHGERVTLREIDLAPVNGFGRPG